MSSKASDLIWIDSCTPGEPSDRSRNRRDVMRKVALRRKRGPNRPHPNSRQLPVFVQDDECNCIPGSQLQTVKPNRTRNFDYGSLLQSVASIPDDDEPPDSRSWAGLRQTRSPAIPSQLVPAGCSLEFADFSLLASPIVGRYTGQRLLENPKNLRYFLGGKNWSYCTYITSSSNQSDLVRYSIDCVVAQVWSFLTSDLKALQRIALSCYSKALSTLQSAINSCSVPTMEVLCATQILGLYEVSSNPREALRS